MTVTGISELVFFQKKKCNTLFGSKVGTSGTRTMTK